jgi:hypothetical protein
LTWVERASSATAAEMPTDEPMLRVSVSSTPASVRCAPASVPKAATLSGTKVSGAPQPCSRPATTTRQAGVSSVNCPIIHSDTAAEPTPAIMISRGSTRPTSRPETIIASIADKPRAAVSQPACVGL